MTTTIDVGLKRCGQMTPPTAGMIDNEQCPCVASYRYTWPGRDEAFVCGEHVQKLRSVAAAMGLPLQIVELRINEAVEATKVPDDDR